MSAATFASARQRQPSAKRRQKPYKKPFTFLHFSFSAAPPSPSNTPPPHTPTRRERADKRAARMSATDAADAAEEVHRLRQFLLKRRRTELGRGSGGEGLMGGWRRAREHAGA